MFWNQPISGQWWKFSANTEAVVEVAKSKSTFFMTIEDMLI